MIIDQEGELLSVSPRNMIQSDSSRHHVVVSSWYGLNKSIVSSRNSEFLSDTKEKLLGVGKLENDGKYSSS